jgi:hypothetical protein
MTNEHDNNKTERRAADKQSETEALMACYNAQPPLPQQPARFYWQEPWHEAPNAPDADAVQAAFEN